MTRWELSAEPAGILRRLRQGRSALIGNGDTRLLFVNGVVHTVDAARSRAQAVAVAGDRIVAVGTDADILPLARDGTEVVDLSGRLLLPGFQDAHVHPVAGGVDMLQCDLHDHHSIEAYLSVIGAYATIHPTPLWILGGDGRWTRSRLASRRRIALTRWWGTAGVPAEP